MALPCLTQGASAQALELYGKSIELEETPRAYFQRAKAHMKLSQPSLAIADLDAAMQVDAKFSKAALLRANIHLELGQCAQAAEDYSWVLKQDPKKRDASKRLPVATACASRLAQAEHYMQRQQYEEARQALEALQGDGMAGSSTKVSLLMAECQLALREFEQAQAITGRVLKKDKNNIQAFNIRAYAFYHAGEYAHAKVHAQQALRVDPEHAQLKDLYHRVKRVVKLHDSAAKLEGNAAELIVVLEELENADPHNSHLRHDTALRLARAYINNKDHESAQIAARRGLRFNPNDVRGLSALGDALIGLEKFDEAVNVWRQAVQHDQQNQSLREGLARAEAALKQSKSKNYYKILGVARSANDREVKRAYRKMALEFHPDKVPQAEREAAETKFQEIAEAYEVLSDSEKRAKYDRGEDVTGNAGQQQQQRGHPFGFGGGGRQQGGFTFQFRAG